MRSREGSVYRRTDGRWAAVVTIPGPGKRKRVTRYADTEREALTIRRKLLREVDAGRLADDCTVAQWLNHWLEQITPERASVRTLANYRGHVTHWIAPTIGRQRLSQLRPEDVRRLRRRVKGTERQARVALRMLLAETADAQQASPTKTVKAWCDDWLPVHADAVRPTAYATDASAVRLWIVPTIGHRRLAMLTPGDVRAVTSAILAAGRTPATAQRAHIVLKKLLRDAEGEGYTLNGWTARPLNTLMPRPRK